jgi:hypothetical protein
MLIQCLQAQIDNSCTVLDYNTNLILTKNGLIKKEQVVLKVNNKSGDCYTSIHLPFSKLEPIDVTVAQIESISGTVIRELKPKEAKIRSDISSNSLYEDRMIYEFDLRHNVYPYVVRYEITRKSKNYIDLCHWTPAYHRELKTEKATLTIQVPTNDKVTAHEMDIAPPSITSNNNGTTNYTWQGSYSPIDNESHSINRYNTFPKVIATTADFHFGIKGNISTWANFGAWYSQLTAGLDELTIGEKKIVDQLKTKSNSSNDLINNLYKHLQTSKRYINVTTDIGGIKPHNAQYVCSNGYGDCKALSNYMKAILSYAGIQSHLVLVYADEKPLNIPSSFPCDMFNHVILCVPNAGDSIWLECTSTINPAGYLGENTQNRDVLLIDGLNSKLVRTPKLIPQQCMVSRTCHIAKNNDTQFKITFNGPSFEEIKGIDKGISQNFHEYILDHYLMPAFDTQTWHFIENNTNLPQVGMEIKGSWGLRTDEELNSKSYLLSYPPINIPQFPKNANRKTPIFFPHPIVLADTTIMQINGDMWQIANSSSINIIGDVANYSKTVEIKDNIIMIIRQLTIPEGTYPALSYPDIANHFTNIRNADRERLIVTQ